MESKLTCLVSLVLLKVRLIEDYLQLMFNDGTILNIYNVYRCDELSLSNLQTKEVVAAGENDEQAFLSFSDGKKLIIGMRNDDYSGPEAMELIRKGESTIVW